MNSESKTIALSGKLSVAAGAVVYSIPGQPAATRQDWRLPVEHIKLIGEYTAAHGPFADDYFLVFVRADGSWQEASFYAEGRETVLAALNAQLGHQLKCGLCNSADLNSRVLWPEKLTGEVLFTFAPVPVSGNLPARIRQKICPEFSFEFSDPVRQALDL